MTKPRPSGEAPDEDLLHLSGKGSEEAFLALYRRHQGSVFRFAMHMSGSQETAEEVTQEVFLALLTSPRRYDPALGSLEAYLIGAARNQVRRYLRSASPEPADMTDIGIEPIDLHRAQDLARLRRAILALPPNYREVLVLCDIEELSYEEAARHLSCAVGTVRSRLHRARAILLAKMRRHAPEGCSV